MTDQQLLALIVAILLNGQSLTSADQVRQARTFADVILKETQQ